MWLIFFQPSSVISYCVRTQLCASTQPCYVALDRALDLGLFFCIHPPPGLLPVLGPLKWYMTPTLDAALLICGSPWRGALAHKATKAGLIWGLYPDLIEGFVRYCKRHNCHGYCSPERDSNLGPSVATISWEIACHLRPLDHHACDIIKLFLKHFHIFRVRLGSGVILG